MYVSSLFPSPAPLTLMKNGVEPPEVGLLVGVLKAVVVVPISIVVVLTEAVVVVSDVGEVVWVELVEELE